MIRPRSKRKLLKYRSILRSLFPFLLSFAAMVVASFILRPSAPDTSLPTINPTTQNSLPILSNPPSVSAKHILILDMATRYPLYSKSADARIYPASTTKMITALVAEDYFQLDRIITVSQSYPEGQDIGLLPGEKLTVEQLLYALLVQSANDAAEILAENYPGGRQGFVSAMNSRAQSLHLKNTRFLNPTGLDEEGHYSTALDLARIAIELLRDSRLAKIVSTENAVVSTPESPHVLTNVNELLGKVEGVLGVKTGFTDLAGESLITLVDRQDRQVLVSILGSEDRFGDTRRLIDWIYSDSD